MKKNLIFFIIRAPFNLKRDISESLNTLTTSFQLNEKYATIEEGLDKNLKNFLLSQQKKFYLIKILRKNEINLYLVHPCVFRNYEVFEFGSAFI